MDAVDRMFRHLVRTIRSRFPQYLGQSFDVTELYQDIIPYRHHRRELGLETNDDYEIALTELLSGARDYLVVDDRMRDTLRAQLASVNPDPTGFKQFAGSSVAISPSALRSLDIGPADDAVPRTAVVSADAVTGAESPAPRSEAATPPPNLAARRSVGLATPSSNAISPRLGERCRSCSEELPSGRAITFCPHCGQNVTTMNCAACGSELEVGWKFCPTCGKPAAT